VREKELEQEGAKKRTRKIAEKKKLKGVGTEAGFERKKEKEVGNSWGEGASLLGES